VGVLVPLLVVAGWGAWSALKPDPLKEARAASDRRDFGAANELLAKYLAENPDDRDARLLAARTARRGDDFGRASEHLAEYARRHQKDEAHALESALLRAQQGNRAEAERLFAEYSARPDAPDAPFVMEAYLKSVLATLPDEPDSIIDPDPGAPEVGARLRAAADLWLGARPGRADQVEGLVWKGRVLRYGREHAKSVAAFREALARDPDHFAARYHLAIALGQEAPEEVVRHLEVLHARRPGDVRLTFALATAHRSVGHGAEARKLLDGMLAADSKNLSALVELGALDLDEGRVADAEPLLRRAHELAPNIPETNLALSRCMQLAGKPDEAAKYRKRFDEIEAERARRLPPPKP
jgi:tetratricopeptide (TPR) repeat protein